MKYLWLLVLALSFVGGCDSKQAPAPGQAKTVRVQLGKRQFTLEVADDDASRQRGLMYRRVLPADGGMIFVFEQEDVLDFWMKNTYIPLDIVYLDKSGKVITIKQMKPLDQTTVSSEKPAKFAIELNEGTAAEVGVKTGDVVLLPWHQ